MIRLIALPSLALAGALALSLAAQADSHEPSKLDLEKADKYKVTGTVTVEATTIQVGVGVKRGTGVLTFEGKEYPFKMTGVSLVGIGATKVEAEGEVFNLEKVEDFPGAWAEVDGSAVLGRAATSGITMRNGGVYMNITGKQEGAQLAVGGGAAKIEFVEAAAE